MSFQFKINSIDVTEQINMRSVVINDQANEKTNTINFKVDKYAGVGSKPQLNDEVEVFHNGNKVFGGVLIQCSDELIGHNLLRYTVKGKDYSQYMDRNLVTERYEDKTVAYIVNELATLYATDFTSLVTSTQVISSMSFNRLTMSQCLQKIANSLNFTWWVDYDKNIHMVKKSDEVAPFGLSDTAGNHIYGSLSINQDISQIRNSVLVQGGEEIGQEKTIEYYGDGSTLQFDTMDKFSNKPTVTVDGVVQTVGIENLDDELSFDYMWSFNEKYIRGTGTPPLIKDPAIDPPNVLITGTPLFPILVKVPEPVSIGKYGEYEFAITDKTIQSQQEGIDRAVAEIQAYANTISEGGFTTNKYGLESGQTINVASAIRDINEQFIIQKVTTRFIGDVSEEIQAEYTVEFATLKTMGIIFVMQKLLLDEEITEGERDVLLTYIQFSDDFTFSDDDVVITVQQPPYIWDDGTGTVGDAKWNFSTWA